MCIKRARPTNAEGASKEELDCAFPFCASFVRVAIQVACHLGETPPETCTGHRGAVDQDGPCAGWPVRRKDVEQRAAW